MRKKRRTLPKVFDDLNVDEIVLEAPGGTRTHMMIPIASTAAGADILAPGLGIACARASHHQSSRKATLGCSGAEETGGCGGGWTSREAGLLSGCSGDILDLIV